MFADRQVEGPFTSWFHRHLCLDDRRGGTLLRDEVDYDPPFGVLGRLLAGPFIQPKLQKMFDYRHQVTQRIVESGEFSLPGPGGPDGERGMPPGADGRSDRMEGGERARIPTPS
jgi:hypothetical protein